MKLPRWLSPVRTVEAETGWPRGVCRRFVARSDDAEGLGELAMWCALSSAASLVMYVALVALLNWLSPALWRGWALYAAGATLAAILSWAYLRRRLARLRRTVDDFRAAPWCLKCWRPDRALKEPAPESVCPECGEPIPPEIAGLVAERASGRSKG